MVWPTSWDGALTGGNLTGMLGEGQLSVPLGKALVPKMAARGTREPSSADKVMRLALTTTNHSQSLYGRSSASCHTVEIVTRVSVSSDITMDIYTHAQDDAKRKALEKFEARLMQ